MLQTNTKIEVDDGGAISEDLKLLEFLPLAPSNLQPTGGIENQIRFNHIVELCKRFDPQLELPCLSSTDKHEDGNRLHFQTSQKQVDTIQPLTSADEITVRKGNNNKP